MVAGSGTGVTGVTLIVPFEIEKLIGLPLASSKATFERFNPLAPGARAVKKITASVPDPEAVPPLPVVKLIIPVVLSITPPANEPPDRNEPAAMLVAEMTAGLKLNEN